MQDNTGSLAKVRVLLEAIQRVDGELSRREEIKMGTPSQAELSRHALELKMSSQTGEHPDLGRSASEGMHPKKSCLRWERLGKKSAASRRLEKWRRRAGTPRAEAAALQQKLFPSRFDLAPRRRGAEHPDRLHGRPRLVDTSSTFGVEISTPTLDDGGSHASGHRIENLFAAAHESLRGTFET